MASGSDAAGAGDRVPRLAPDCDPTRLALTPSEGFLLSRIDGHTPWAVLREIGGLPPEQVDACLERWHADGILVSNTGAASGNDAESKSADDGAKAAAGAKDGAQSDSSGAAQTSPAPGPNGKSQGPDARIDPSLDLDVEMQERILELVERLEGPYHEILGVARDASVKNIKRTYFSLSKEYHPDRYFRRNIGPFAELLDRVFKKILEAYELLSDPATRAEVEASMDHEAPLQEARPEAPLEATADAPGGDSADQARKRELLERIRKRFKIPEQIVNERKMKARQFAQAASVAARGNRWSEAASSIRLAIAFDPWNSEYKAPFAEIQAKVLEHRAMSLLEEAESGEGKNPLRLYEEALHCRPYDPEINYKAAAVALKMGQGPAAQEYAERACELCPDEGRYRLLLGEAYREVGRLDGAKEQFEKVLEHEPGNREAKQGLGAVQRESRRRRKLGGKR